MHQHFEQLPRNKFISMILNGDEGRMSLLVRPKVVEHVLSE
jgi:hypothetical protein